METCARWSALLVGAAYVGVGVAGWLRPTTAIDPIISNQFILVGLWAATAILAFGFARPDMFQITTRDVGPWLALALAAPLALLSIRASGEIALTVVLWPLAVLPLGIALGGSSSRPDVMLAGALTALAIVLGIPTYLEREPNIELAILHTVAVTAIALAPVLVSVRRGPERDPIQAGRVLIGLTPITGAVALAVPTLGLVVLAAGLFTMALVNRFALRPLARAVTQATVQRDVAVAAVEAERRRLAADIHDGPLQSLLLLGRQLEEQGHRDAAVTARTIAGELRDVAGELRLPLLDDLGVGPALDWLADRARRMTGVTVTVEYQGNQRPPPEVELAAFRIAQEAIANSIRHGEPPIIVNYRSSGERVLLTIDDAGRGFQAAAVSGSGSHGLLNMAQRAEQIGARLDLVHRPDRGMHVGVEWTAAG
jgi:signal transduction histidine kinase